MRPGRAHTVVTSLLIYDDMSFLESLFYVIWRGIAIGVIISAPMGPVGILCVQRTLEKGRRIGLYTGVGAAISDLFYCLLTGFGLSFIEDFLNENQNVIQIIGSVVLAIFGVYLFRSNPARSLKKPGEEEVSRGKNVLSGFLFTFSNPLIIFLIIGLFARFNFLLPEIPFPLYIIGFASIIAGALMWWWVVTFFVDKVRSHFNLRSMWLINKITGGIIMLFALVGVITAVSNLAKAATRTPVCLNSKRGFGQLSGSQEQTVGSPLRIVAGKSDTVVRYLPLVGSSAFDLSFRGADPSRHTNTHWGLLMKGNGKTSRVEVRTVNDRFDPLSEPRLEVCVVSPDKEPERFSLNSGIDIEGDCNSFAFSGANGELAMRAGNRQYKPVFNGIIIGNCDSIGFWVAPGGSLELDDIVLYGSQPSHSPDKSDLSHFALPDVRNSYFSRSSDEIEGVWEVYDRMLDDSRLRSGGNYRLAIVSRDGGYELIYLSGAKTLPSLWQPGMKKGSLQSTSFRGVFDVCWLNPSGDPLPGEIKAQYESPGVLSFQFPSHGSSTMRLRKIKENGK